MQKYVLLVIIVVTTLPSIVFAQTIESYQDRKKSERKEPNQFLTGESMDNSSQLGVFYRRSFLKNQTKQGFQYLQGSNIPGGLSQGNGTLLNIPLEGAVDPEEYIVGPGDVFAVSIWGPLSLNEQVFVTPEGSIIIPNVGEILVAGKTLRATKNVADSVLRSKYNKATFSLTLLSPRYFSVHVSGIVSNPGKVDVTAIDRADKAIYLATLSQGLESNAKREPNEDPGPSEFISITESVPVELPRLSLRNIYILRGNDTLFIDLLSYYATGRLEYNPHLLDGDIIVVPAEQLVHNSISISGGVRLPGTFEYHPGDDLRAAVNIAQGFKKMAIIDSIEISRLGPNGVTTSTLLINGTALENTSYRFPLQIGDRIFVREHFVETENAAVSIKGEVRLNGEFSIINGKTKLTEVMRKAGGFTENAAFSEAIILRSDINHELDPLQRNPDYRRLSEMRLSALLKEERDYFTFEEAILRNQVSVDFAKLFSGDKEAMDPSLFNGDQIIVPSKQRTVFVFGQITRPGHLTWVDGMDDDFYIERAGGISDAADDGGIKVIKAGSRAWVDPGDTTIEPGDAIYIPRNPDRDFVFYFTAIRDFLQVTIAAVTIYLLIEQIQRD